MIDILAFLSLLIWIYLAFFHGNYWRPLFFGEYLPPESWPSVDIIVPARNEAEMITKTLPSLLRQDYEGEWRVILVDDNSTDGTADMAKLMASEEGAGHKIKVINAPEPHEGWSGKVAAMQLGVEAGNSDFILFTDADINHPPNSLRRLVSHSMAEGLDLNSLMVKLNCESIAEKLLIPAFVYFFMMLYPFRKSNESSSRIAAAAGGVMLVNRASLVRSGGLRAIKSALIDDCSLAKLIKESGGNFNDTGRTSIALSKDVISLRPYPDLESIKNMVVRSAYTQLRYSPFLLAATILGMITMFIIPLIAPLYGGNSAAVAGFLSLGALLYLYSPMVSYYGLPKVWALSLPISALLYMLATLDSAYKHWQGIGGIWKGRAQAA